MSDQETIDQALNILESRLQKTGCQLTSTKDTSSYLKLKLSELEYESFRVMFLDAQHHLISMTELFRGTINASAVYPREVVKTALHFNAAALILAHNHPSGDVTPSEADKKTTEKLKDALRLIDVPVLDHIVVGGNQSYSFAEHGLI